MEALLSLHQYSLPVGVGIFNSVCTDNIIMDQEAHTGGSTAGQRPPWGNDHVVQPPPRGGLSSALPALLRAHGQGTRPGREEAAQK